MSQNGQNCVGGRDSAVDPAWGTSQRSPDPLARLTGRGEKGKRREGRRAGGEVGEGDGCAPQLQLPDPPLRMDY